MLIKHCIHSFPCNIGGAVLHRHPFVGYFPYVCLYMAESVILKEIPYCIGCREYYRTYCPVGNNIAGIPRWLDDPRDIFY